VASIIFFPSKTAFEYRWRATKLASGWRRTIDILTAVARLMCARSNVRRHDMQGRIKWFGEKYGFIEPLAPGLSACIQQELNARSGAQHFRY
jgi:hypothetical protein